VVGREGGQVRLTVAAHTDGATLRGVVGGGTRPGAMVYTDEWGGYGGLEALGRGHATVCHADREWARDDDGDGVREVHDNTLEGLWTGLRNFLRLFRGVSKKYLHQYVAMFEWGYNVKRATPGFVWALLGAAVPPPALHEPPELFRPGPTKRPPAASNVLIYATLSAHTEASCEFTVRPAVFLRIFPVAAG
jgi:transposase